MSAVITYLSQLEDGPPQEPPMRFRLTYEGPLRPGQRDPEGTQPDKLAEHKQSLRKVFHRQLRHLWATNKFLSETKVDPNWSTSRPPSEVVRLFGFPAGTTPFAEAVAKDYHQFGYRFVPLVRARDSLLCSLHVLFLRRDFPGSVIRAGDLDNRIKTLIDGLRRPGNASELGGNERPGPGEDPFYCLLEDDKLVTQLTVETDTLLDPPTGSENDNRQVRLVITVELKPYNVTMFNLSFS